MPPPKKSASTLGKAIIRDRFKGSRPKDNDTTLHTTEMDDGPKWVKLQSITQERDLDEFLSTAMLAGTEFTAERHNIKVVTNNYKVNLFLPSEEEEEEAKKRHLENKAKLTVPRRPQWDKTTTPEELQKNERDSFLHWRRELARLEEEQNVILTPFERNLEVWRQLWRVIERSDIVVQIVDARNPILFRSTDLDVYVSEIADGKKKSLLLVNKADMLTAKQRQHWADYFDSHNIRYTFFSAALAKKKLEEEEARKAEAELKALQEQTVTEGDEDEEEEEEEDSEEMEAISEEAYPREEEEEEEEEEDERTRIRTSSDLFEVLMAEGPDPKDRCSENHLTVGLVGYPNVGKSSTINALAGEKRVSVSSTPGKTKHFQTLHLTPDLMICDCPGLVFPTFATSKADLVCNGVLPIDQLREWTGPVALVARRVPRYVIEKVYGIEIKIRSIEEGGDGIATAAELSSAYAAARGFTVSGRSGSVLGNPDQSRASRYILKDYVNGKLLYTHPPPGVDEKEFVKEVYEPSRWSKIAHDEDEDEASKEARMEALTAAPTRSATGDGFDNKFFTGGNLGVQTMGKFIEKDFRRVKLFPHQGVMSAVALSEGDRGGEKRHKKGKKNVKRRSGEGY